MYKSNNLNIMHLIESSGIGGAEKLVLDLCIKSKEYGYNPFVVTLKEGWLTNKLNYNKIETIIVKNKYAIDFSFLYKIIKLIKMKNVDILHSHEFTMNTYGSMASYITNCPIIATIHGKIYYNDKWRRRFVYKIMSILATKIIVVSENLKYFLIDNIKMNSNKLTVIHNGINPDNYQLITKDEMEKLKISLGISGKVIGSIGNLYPVKGHIYLIKAAKIVMDKIQDASVIIVGKKTNYIKELQSEIDRQKLGEKVKLIGFRDDIASILQIIDVFVLPSLQETFSLATIEALFMEKPVVVTKCGGPEEIIEDRVHGFLVSKYDYFEMAEKIIELLNNNMLAKSFGVKGKKLVINKYTTDIMFNNYKNIYYSCLK